jgi:hypothetical protein
VNAHGSTTTTDHDTIRRRAGARGGHPARVADTGDEGGLLRTDLRDADQRFAEIGWATFFRVFEDRKAAFLDQDRTAGRKTSRFYTFVTRG